MVKIEIRLDLHFKTIIKLFTRILYHQKASILEYNYFIMFRDAFNTKIDFLKEKSSLVINISEKCCNQMENLLFIAPYNKTRRNDGRKSIVCSRERYVATVIVRWESYRRSSISFSFHEHLIHVFLSRNKIFITRLRNYKVFVI